MTNVLFDLDGTLTDPFEGITRTHQHALREIGYPQIPTQEELARFIGPPLRETYAILLGPTATRDEIERAVAVYRERFGRIGLNENVVYPGIEPMLATLVDHENRLFLATSKMRPFAQRILDHFDLSRFFTGVYGSDPDGRFDDKADLLAHLLEHAGLAAADTVMIGDRSHDVRAAKRSAIRAIGVTWGYGTSEELLTAGADHLCAHPAELPDAIVGP